MTAFMGRFTRKIRFRLQKWEKNTITICIGPEVAPRRFYIKVKHAVR